MWLFVFLLEGTPSGGHELSGHALPVVRFAVGRVLGSLCLNQTLAASKAIQEEVVQSLAFLYGYSLGSWDFKTFCWKQLEFSILNLLTVVHFLQKGLLQQRGK